MVQLRTEDFSLDEVARLIKSPEVGAVCIYLGTVRQFPRGSGLEFEERQSAIQALEEIEKKALSRFDIKDVAIIHRTGFLSISENILLIAVSAVHRQPAFAACQTIIDDIKDLHRSWAREVAER